MEFLKESIDDFISVAKRFKKEPSNFALTKRANKTVKDLLFDIQDLAIELNDERTEDIIKEALESYDIFKGTGVGDEYSDRENFCASFYVNVDTVRSILPMLTERELITDDNYFLLSTSCDMYRAQLNNQTKTLFEHRLRKNPEQYEGYINKEGIDVEEFFDYQRELNIQPEMSTDHHIYSNGPTSEYTFILANQAQHRVDCKDSTKQKENDILGRKSFKSIIPPIKYLQSSIYLQ